MPEIEGVLTRKATHLTARDAQEGDKNLLGETINPGRKVIVRKRECRETDSGLDPSVAPPIPQVHAHDWKAYGDWQEQKNRDGKYIAGEKREIYYTCAVYFVVNPVGDTVVYQGSIYSVRDPRIKAFREAIGTEKIGA